MHYSVAYWDPKAGKTGEGAYVGRCMPATQEEAHKKALLWVSEGKRIKLIMDPTKDASKRPTIAALQAQIDQLTKLLGKS
jgi:hypothetical protein